MEKIGGRKKALVILKSITIITTICIVLFLTLYFIYLLRKFNQNIFRLSPNQVSVLLSNKTPKCVKIFDCKLLPGDILIRRYITARTKTAERLFHPYFTHSAVYLGNDELIEAVGTEKDRADDIQISILSKSDWLDTNIESFVIFRPKYSTLQLKNIIENYKKIANDPDYIFGLPKSGRKTATCADLIYDRLASEGIINTQNTQETITPDYLFWVSIQDKNNQIIGYN